MADDTTDTTETDADVETAGETGETGETGRGNGQAGPLRVALGERPDALPEKFFDADTGELRLDALLKAEADSRRRITELTTPRTPKDGYEFRVPEQFADMGFSDADPLVQAVMEHARTKGWGQDDVDELVGVALEHMVPSRDEAVAALQQDFGRKAAAVYDATETWIETFEDTGVRQTLHQIQLMPGGAKALKAIRDAGREGGPIDGANATPPAELTEDGLKQLMQSPDYWSNAQLQKRVADGFRRLYPDEGPAR